MTGEENLGVGPARVLLVAQPLMSWGLERLLESDHGRWSIIGVAASAAEAVLRLELITPDVIVFDLEARRVPSRWPTCSRRPRPMSWP